MAKKRGDDLVVQHVEKMSRKLLETHHGLVREYIGGRVGLYALYNKKQLHYVGLASNLRSRLTTHFRDRHGDAWDTFSLYLTGTAEHLRELEALLIRVAKPKGNRSKTKLPGSHDLQQHFRRFIKERNEKELTELFGVSGAAARRLRQMPVSGKAPTLAEYISKKTRIQWERKDQTYRAWIYPDGKIQFKGKLFNSPSLAASHITKRAMNGWHVWRFEASPGTWERLDVLRRGQKASAGKASSSPPKGKAPTLEGYFSKRTPIRWLRKDTTFKAVVLKDGRIQFQGRIFTSPSSAASQVTKRAMNGWDCWRYESPDGEWVKLDKLRKLSSRKHR